MEEKKEVFTSNTEETFGKKLGSYHLDSNGDVAIVDETFSYTEEGDLVTKQVLNTVDLKPKQAEILKGYIVIRDHMRSHLELMINKADDESFEVSMSRLNVLYDAFESQFGPINKATNARLIKNDPDANIALSLEKWDKKAKTAQKSQIFFERTIYPRVKVEHTDSIDDAILISYSELGKVDPDYIEQLTNRDFGEIVDEMKNKLFLNPESLEWEHQSVYLSGHVRNKLAAAKKAAELDDKYLTNVENLEKVQPEDIPHYEIKYRLGSNWIPESDIQRFTQLIVRGEDEPVSASYEKEFLVTKTKGTWNFEVSTWIQGVNKGRCTTEFGTGDWSAPRLIEAILNGRSIKVTKEVEGKRVIAKEPTAEAVAKAELI